MNEIVVGGLDAFDPDEATTHGHFIEGFAGPNPGDRNPAKAAYRPTGAAVAPDGSLYVVEGEKGRLWHIVYTGKN